MTFRSPEDKAKFQEICDAYGGDIQRWPVEHRTWASGIADESEAAQRLLQDAAGLDRMLDATAAPQPSPELQAAVLMGFARTAELRWWPFRAIWQPIAGMALALALGVMVGFVTPPVAIQANGANAEFVLDELTAGDGMVGEVSI